MSTVVQNPATNAGNRVAAALGALLLAVYMYCQITSFIFLSACDGSFLMYRAAELGFVSAAYAQAHPVDVVLFRQDSDGKWEYRVPLAVLGYAGIPGVVIHRTSANLLEACNTRGPNGSFGCRQNATS
jgi:hypothetical protein